MTLSKKRILWAVFGMMIGGALSGCWKSDKQSTAGGGSSTQSVMTLKGAPR